jgi:ribosome-associated protein
MIEKNIAVSVSSEYITLGQFLKLAKIIRSGGEEKAYLATHEIAVNGEKEIRRGRKLRVKDVIVIEGKSYQICSSNV